MIFGAHPVAQSEGAILAHSVKLASRRLRKGLVLSAEDVEALKAAGISEVVVARLEEGDVDENTAARRLAGNVSENPEADGLKLAEAFTGRVNVVANGAGVVRVDAGKIAGFNTIDPMITVATLPDMYQVDANTLLATIKVIAFAVPDESVERAASFLRDAVRVEEPKLQGATLIVTEIEGVDGMKGVKAIRDRLSRLDVELVEVVQVPHAQDEIGTAIEESTTDLILILTASATSDPHDVAPEALRRAGGHVERFGMPVDPGNLLFIGNRNGVPVIGLPGCARSPAMNGADWVLSRVICGIEVTDQDIAGMGVGGLLKEIPTRPHPRNRTK